MTAKDKTRLDELFKVLDKNLRIAEIYAAYLSSVPELITKDMMDAMLEDGDIEAKDAIIAILSSACGLDYDRSRAERDLIRDYITPSVTLLNKEKYTSDPYFRNILLDSITSGRWEVRHETYPAYRAVVCGDVSVLPDMREVYPIGFFAEEFTFPAILEDGNEWMTLLPVDTDTVVNEIRDAHGRVVTFGLGLGYYAYMVSEKEDVTEVTVIEKSAEVIKLFSEHILPKFPNRDKIRIICADAFEYAAGDMIGEEFDYAFVDTWRDASDGAPMYLRMKRLEHLHKKTVFSYWIEGFIISRIRAYRYSVLRELLDTGADIAPKSYDEAVKFLMD